MQIRTVIIVKLLFLWQGIALTEHQLDIPRSPCPRLFQYKFNGNDWYGELELPSPPIQPGEIVLTLILTLRAATTVSRIRIICNQNTSQYWVEEAQRMKLTSSSSAHCLCTECLYG